MMSATFVVLLIEDILLTSVFVGMIIYNFVDERKERRGKK